MEGAVNKWACKSDEELRPWTLNVQQDNDIKSAKKELAGTITMTSYTRDAGAPGSSLLDGRPPELQELDQMMDTLEAEEYAALVSNDSCPQSDEFAEEDPEECEEGVEMNDSEDEDGKDEDVLMPLNTSPIRKPKSNCIKTIVYKKRPGPAILNMSTAKYKQLVKILQDHNHLLGRGEGKPPTKEEVARAFSVLPKHYAGKPLQISDSVELASSLLISGQRNAGEFSTLERDCTMPGSPPKDATKKPKKKMRNHKDESDAASGDTILFSKAQVSKTPLDEILDKINKPSVVGTHILHTSRGDEIDKDGKTAELLTVGMNKVQLEPLQMPASINSKDANFPGVKDDMAPATGTTEGSKTSRSFFMTMLTDEDRISNDELKRVQNMELNSNTRRNYKIPIPSNRVGNNALFNNNPNNTGSLPATPAGCSARSRDGAYSARSRDGAYSARNATLDKISISSGEGTATAEPFSRSKIKEIKSIREQLMTTSGIEAMNARLLMIEAANALGTPDDGGDKEFLRTLSRNSSGARKTNQDQRNVLMKLVKETKDKNTVDQTWPLFVTAGYEEVLGSEQFYASHTKRVFSPQSLSRVKLQSEPTGYVSKAKDGNSSGRSYSTSDLKPNGMDFEVLK